MTSQIGSQWLPNCFDLDDFSPSRLCLASMNSHFRSPSFPFITPRVVSIKIIGIVNIGLVSGSVSLPALRAHVLFFLPALIVPAIPTRQQIGQIWTTRNKLGRWKMQNSNKFYRAYLVLFVSKLLAMAMASSRNCDNAFRLPLLCICK